MSGDRQHPSDATPGESPEPRERLIDRRTLLKGGLAAGGALAGGGAAALAAELVSRVTGSSHPGGGAAGGGHGGGSHGAGASERQAAGQGRVGAGGGHMAPNILVIVIDQMRFPQWFSASRRAQAMMPNLARLQRGAVTFAGHYTASNDCTPARATLLTGLHTHQTGCMITGGSTLDPSFPTWGTMLREHGYRTAWFGKWHLTHGDNRWDPFTDGGALEPYGFSGGTYPSPDGGPGQGWRVDPHVAWQFERWLARAPRQQPWCTTVSFVNPHDIAWWYVWSNRTFWESHAPSVVGRLPANFETPADLLRRGKPRLQRALQETAEASFGQVPYAGAGMERAWLPFMDLYLKLLARVDGHIGQVLSALQSRPQVASNTIVLFTSDHGEYGSSHGLRGKGAGVYEEAIRVPLVVKDLRGKTTKAPAKVRQGLTSSVDIAPLLLSLATDSESWRSDSHYAHIAHRHDIKAMLEDPAAPGREYVLHATDEIVTEFAVEPYAADAPLHVAAIRTPSAKYAVYSNFYPRSVLARKRGREAELYDYRTRGGRMEIENVAHRSPLREQLSAQLRAAIREELRAPLPKRLHTAQKRGFADYFDTAGHAAMAASLHRRKALERHAGEPPNPAAGETTALAGPRHSTASARLRANRAKTIRRTKR